MLLRSLTVGLLVPLATGLLALPSSNGQEAAAGGDPPSVPKGVEVLARGPVHEAFATLTAEPKPTERVSKRPPKPLDEMPPAEKPEGDVSWISGYWGWDDERKDFLWVSGVWRAAPPGKQWVAGYWREDGERWQWVPGFWTMAAKDDTPQNLTYLPQPPAPPAVAPPGEAPAPNTFYVPGTYVWDGNRSDYAWRAGYWARVEPGYVWVPAHYRWTPSGYLFIGGYWDLAVSRRGVLYAPVYVSPEVVTVGFTYTPYYAVREALVVDSLFVRPAYCHYYFGDYYGEAYVGLGFESCYVYSRRNYDAIIVYERYEHRADPNWFSLQINVYNDRYYGRAPVPPRTLVQQNTIVQNVTNVTNVTNVNNNTIVNNNTNVTNTANVNNRTVSNMTMLASAKQVEAAKGVRTVPLDTATRQQAKQQAVQVQQVASQRTRTESGQPPARGSQPRIASLNVPKTAPVGTSVSTSGQNPSASRGGIGSAATGHPAVGAPAPGTGQGGVNRPGMAGVMGHPSTPAAGRSENPTTPGLGHSADAAIQRGATPYRSTTLGVAAPGPSGLQPGKTFTPPPAPPGGRIIPGTGGPGGPGQPGVNGQRPQPRPVPQPRPPEPSRRPPPKDPNATDRR